MCDFIYYILGCDYFYNCCLQEVETEQYYNFFLPELKEQGYDGFFSPKSRARTMSESDRKHVDGCAIFYKTEKYVPTVLFLCEGKKKNHL